LNRKQEFFKYTVETGIESREKGSCGSLPGLSERKNSIDPHRAFCHNKNERFEVEGLRFKGNLSQPVLIF
jgi:hypothetical protein